MILDVLKRRGQGAIFAFEIMKKYFLTKKLQPKTFVDMFLPGRFWKYIFLKKKQNFDFQKNIGNFRKFQNFKIFDFKKIFFSETIFFQKLQDTCFSKKNVFLKKTFFKSQKNVIFEIYIFC